MLTEGDIVEIKEGHKVCAMVPREPTPEMVKAGEDAWDRQLMQRLQERRTYPETDITQHCAYVAYIDMLAAAQPKDETPDEARQDGYELGLMAQPKNGELLALADEMDRWRDIPQGELDKMGHRLRTLASRRVVVTDEMVERACVGMSLEIEADGEWPKDYPDDEQAIIRNGMRAALTAALQPDSEEE